MKLKFFTLLFLSACLLSFKSRAQTRAEVKLQGHLSNTGGLSIKIGISSFDQATVTDFRRADSIIYVNTDIDGNFSAVLYVPSLSNNSRVFSFFTNCKNIVKDTSLVVTDSVVTWNSDYCPPCPSTFTVTYCPCPDNFYLEIDTALIKSNTILWDFGDGTTSTGAFPTHNYSDRTLYRVCATVIDAKSRGVLCSHCQYLGYDSTGHLVARKESSGFTLSVIQKGTLGQLQDAPANTFEVVQNPVGDNAGIEMYSDITANYNIRIFNSIGQLMKTFNQPVASGYSTFSLDVSNLKQGIYFMNITFGDKQVNRKFLK